MFRNVEVLQSRNGECNLDVNRLVRWSDILLYLPGFAGISTGGVTASILFEFSPFYEGLNSILEMDTIFSQVPMAPVIRAVLASIYLGFSRSGARTLDAAVLEICIRALR